MLGWTFLTQMASLSFTIQFRWEVNCFKQPVMQTVLKTALSQVPLYSGRHALPLQRVGSLAAKAQVPNDV